MFYTIFLLLSHFFNGSIYISPFAGRVFNEDRTGAYSYLEFSLAKRVTFFSIEAKVGFAGLYFEDYGRYRSLFLLEAETWFSPYRYLKEAKDYTLYFYPEEVFFEIEKRNKTFRIGRFLLPWEINYFFSHFSFFTPSYRFSPFYYKVGSLDGIGFTSSQGLSKFELYWLPTKTDSLRWGTRIRTLLGPFEFHFLATRGKSGIGVLMNFLDGVLKAEFLRRGEELVYGLSYDRSFKRDIFLIIEYTKDYEFLYGLSDVLSLEIEKIAAPWEFSFSYCKMTNLKESLFLLNGGYEILEDLEFEISLLHEGKEKETFLLSTAGKFYF